MKVLYVGDIIKLNGPSMVDFNIFNHVKPAMIYFSQSNDFTSLALDIKNFLKCDVIHVSGVSAKGALFFVLSVFLFKRRFFLMHSSLHIEKKIKNIKIKRYFFEIILVFLSTKIICVSNVLRADVSKIYSRNKNKIKVIPNGLSLPKKIIKNKSSSSGTLNILCVGGGRPEKGILKVCESVEFLIKKNGLNIDLIILGEEGEDSKLINNYDFVKNKGFVSYDELLGYLNHSHIFIQNSLFESFSLSLFDALINSSYCIVSENVGAIEYLDKIDSDMFSIVKYNSMNEINEKILSYNENRINKPMRGNYKHLCWTNIAEQYVNTWRNTID